MTNSIIGQSKEHAEQTDLQNQSNALQGKLNRVFQDQLTKHENRLTNLEDTMRVNGIMEMKVTRSVNRAVVTILGGKKSKVYTNRSLRGRAYSGINSDIKRKFGIPRRSELPAKDYEKCMEFIENWIPDAELIADIRAADGK